MPYNDSLNQSRATLYGVTRADWNQAMEDTNLLRAAQLGVSVAADGNVTFAARTGSNWTGVGAANAAGDFYSAFAGNAAELIAAGYSKGQVRWRAVTLCTWDRTITPPSWIVTMPTGKSGSVVPGVADQMARHAAIIAGSMQP